MFVYFAWNNFVRYITTVGAWIVQYIVTRLRDRRPMFNSRERQVVFSMSSSPDRLWVLFR